MTRILIAPIVEGQGEVEAIRCLLDRIWYEMIGGEFIEVLRPVRQKRTKLLRKDRSTGLTVADTKECERAIKLAALKLYDKDKGDLLASRMVLLMLDADEDCPRDLVKLIRNNIPDVNPALDLSIVFTCVEYETWFVAAAASLDKYLSLQPEDSEISDPERQRLGKGWIQQRFKSTPYSETLDQVKLTAAMDLDLCRKRSPSFNKLCRELERRAAR